MSYEVDGPVARITLRRPKRHNAQTPSMWHMLAEIGASLADEVRVVVLSGEGPSFSAGIDRRMLTREIADEEFVVDHFDDHDKMRDMIGSYQAGFTWLRDPRFVSIAAVHGHAIGAGFQLALGCDLRIATVDAQFTMAETSLGLVPDLAGTKILVETVGYSRALEMCATGRRIGAVEAERLGIAQLVVEADQLSGTVDDLIAAITAPMPGAVRDLKALLLGATGNSVEEQLLAERTAQVARFVDIHSQLTN